MKVNTSKKDSDAEEIFNGLNIRYRVCYKFVAKSKDDSDTCVCNRPKGNHAPSEETENGKWTMDQNTCEELNPAHGKLPNSAPFAQLALDTPETKVEQILRHVWKIDAARLVLSIIGGAKYFRLSDQLEANFINGIINVALKSNAWLITNGYNVGIVQLVGQAINKVKLTNPNKRITAIGLCKWGSVKDIERLTDPRTRKKQGFTNPSVGNNDQERKETKRESGQRDLEMNHSHYLMLDDGRLRYYDIGGYRTRLCAQIAKLEHESDFPIPVVTMVVEGGKDTITNMYYDLRAHIPVVIIDGSGRVADFFKRWLLYTKEFDHTSDDSDIAYEIEEIDRVSHFKTLPPITTDHPEEESRSKTKNVTRVQLSLDSTRKTLQSKFSKYAKQLEQDLNDIISHDEDTSKTKRKTSQSTVDSSKRLEKIKSAVGQVMYCLQPAVRSGISVFNLNSEDSLSETIFRSICKSRQKYFERRENEQNDTLEMSQRKVRPSTSSHDKQRQTISRQNVKKKDQNAQRSQLLQLAMDWDCIDVAKELILQNSLDNILNKEQAFVNALTADLPTFVYEFLKLGIDPSRIFFPAGDFVEAPGKSRYKKFLDLLYTEKAVNSDETHLAEFLESDVDVLGKHIHTTDDLNALVDTLLGDYMHKLYFDTAEEETKYRRLWGYNDESVERNQVAAYSVESPNPNHEIENQEKARDYVMRDLFIWSILMNRIDMAKVLLCHTKYRICSALIATKILHEYHEVASHGELKEGYKASAEDFQQYAIDCLKQCRKNDADEACHIVLQRIELYGNVTCLQVASDAKDKLFIAEPSCVQAMNNAWYDKLQPQHRTNGHVIGNIIGFFSLGFLAPFLVNFRKDTEGPKYESLQESLQPYGINYSDPYPLKYPHYVKVPLIDQYIHRWINFHQALQMKYFYHCITYVFFLLLFSFVLLFAFNPPSDRIPSIHWTEILTIILVSFMLIEEIHFFASLDPINFSAKFFSYFRNLFKIMTIVGFVLFYIGLILRFVHAGSEDQFVAARVVMAIDLEIWWLRSLSFIIVVPFLGPHLVAIGKMLKDLLFFMCIIAIVMTAYGVASRSMVYYPNPNAFNDTVTDTSFDGRILFRQIIYPVYYLLYGQFNNELSDLDMYPNAAWSISTQVLLAIHMLFVNILLTNLLIAMFSKRFDQVYDDTKNIWHSQQYIFTREYNTRSPFFPPISFLFDIYHLCRLAFFTLRRLLFKRSADRRAKVFKIIPISSDRIKDWYQFESASTYEYAHAAVKASRDASETLTSGLDSIVEKSDDANDTTTDANSSASSMRTVQDDLAKLHLSLGEIKDQLRELIEIRSDVRGK